MHHLLKHINQDIEMRQNRDKDLTLNKNEYRSKINPADQPRLGLTTAKASGPKELGPNHLINRLVFKLESS